jgi:GMP synthase-like glutamine amidotransferase
MGVGDSGRWPHLPITMELVRSAARDRVPVLGICLGGQIAAAALGGSVGRAPAGVEIGWVQVRPTDSGRRDPVTSAVGNGMLLFTWHHDEFEPPPEATPLLTADACPSQGFRRGTVWGLQPHPEVDGRIIRMWARSPGGVADLEAAGVRLEDLTAGAGERAALARGILDAWCAVVVGRTPSPDPWTATSPPGGEPVGSARNVKPAQAIPRSWPPTPRG